MKPINTKINPKFLIQAKKLTQFTQLVQRVLPVECHNHVKVANIRDQNLMLITDSPVWTTKLRQLSPQILQFIRSNTPETEAQIHHVQISTRYHADNKPNNQQTDNPQTRNQSNRHKPHISEKSATLLSQSANSIEHQALKAALLKVAQHANTTRDKPNKTVK
ncbi:hypothetical protein MNBD_GAMMA06-346 [hydrothermal vent metagenome]|uniref:Zn-ribbon-containing, possibly RNA-binding protein and truncated derivatives n=1 Tax=hydrothermal vent metagenome TaxID=652676 RepID=A0A3B0W6U7_9ZZZZ